MGHLWETLFIDKWYTLENMITIAKVKTRAGLRKGRGFSEGELKEAGLTVAVARELKIAVDSRRKTTYDFNVADLKKLKVPEKKPKAAKIAKAPKKKVAKTPAKKSVAKNAAPKSKAKKSTKK